MRPSFLLAVFLCSTAAVAQDRRHALKLSPLELVDDISFPAIQIGYEQHLFGRISWYNEAGWQYRRSAWRPVDTVQVRERGFKARTELRYYLTGSDPRRLEGYYVAVNGFYIHDWHNGGVSYYYRKDSSDLRSDQFGVERSVLGANVVLGVQSTGRGRFAMDAYGGFGLRFRRFETRNQEVIYGTDALMLPVDLTVGSMQQMAEVKGGRSLTGNLTIGFRVCYLF